jgi:hypothetical protein
MKWMSECNVVLSNRSHRPSAGGTAFRKLESGEQLRDHLTSELSLSFKCVVSVQAISIREETSRSEQSTHVHPSSRDRQDYSA